MEDKEWKDALSKKSGKRNRVSKNKSKLNLDEKSIPILQSVNHFLMITNAVQHCPTGPKFECNQEFDFENPEEIALFATEMMTRLTELESRYLFESPAGPPARFELTRMPISPTSWKMELLVSPILWFDVLLKNESSRVQLARKYVDRIRTEQVEVQQSYNPKIPINFSVPKYCDRQLDCEHLKLRRTCRNVHTEFVCSAATTRRDGFASKCGWYITEESVVMKEWAIQNCDKFVFQARPERVREILMLPRPPKLTPESLYRHSEHLTNSKIVCDPYTWETLYKVIKYLDGLLGNSAVEKIALNYGPWETGLSRDPEADDCHAHIHLELSREFIDFISNDKSFTQFISLQHKNGNPKNYTFSDCDKLENNRLLSAEASLLTLKVDSLSSKIDDILSSLQKLSSTKKSEQVPDDP